ncbi:MAG: hypothetical protein A2X35_00985 [Elusimicrobia bacterium GWA2_61_42]|nr:MAG: hypothetical protein A2X35_00985 [Elusimicrobia bacterium GWA2_61_42]OGR75212.1 MAG: hypothetical protein A2X38_04800 [Elusimicrobia bacterium GWC2_61_25]
MKKLNIVLSLLLLAAAPALAGKDKAAGEAVVLPDVEMIDVPTAGILDYYGFMVKTRFYSDGGVLGALNFGVLERLNLGAAMTIDKLVGSDSGIKMRKPEIQVKFRFYDGGYYIPAAAVGYDGQGYYYNPVSKKYLEKGKGLYLVGSKEIGVPSLVLHGGLNVPDFDNNYLFGFLGVNYTLEDKIAFMLELDNMFHSNDPSRLNAGTRIYITPYFQLDLAMREIGRNGKFDNGDSRKAERIVQMRYNTSF